MKFIADLHIHSKYSRATAKNLDFENLYHAAQIKGISVVGTGDFTFPAWVDEIESKLEEAEPGLFALKKEFAQKIDETVPQSCRRPVRFILQSEISNIYKKDDRVRKNHNLIYFPDMESVKKFNARLDAIGNIKSDGRPILGMDAADLLALMLEINDKGFFVPAHIWTPWFSLFGSKSGFDSMEECFGDLTPHIFAVETGLSSDPPMNWRVKDLDEMCLIASSDAHSPGYLGRNATVFDTQLSFSHIRQALESHDTSLCKGTLDMFPHLGKYHFDGHRNCNVCLNPVQTREFSGICPECGKKLTVGVLYRVQELADRPEGYVPENRPGFRSIVPLAEILSEIFAVGPKTKKVTTYYDRAIETLGPELDILLDYPIEKIEAARIPLLSDAIAKMRQGDVEIQPGFDGEFGKVMLFTEEEKKRLQGEKYPLFKLPKEKKRSIPAVKKKKKAATSSETKVTDIPIKKETDKGLLENLNPLQQQAVYSTARQIIIQAGPGTGKTRTLTARIAWLISEKKVAPEQILALTFTNKAAGQLQEKTAPFSEKNQKPVMAATFHSFCLELLKQHSRFDRMIADDFRRQWLVSKAADKKLTKKENRKLQSQLSRCKQQLLSCDSDLSEISGIEDVKAFKAFYKAYEQLCRKYHLVDFEDLIFSVIQMFNETPSILETVKQQYQYVLVDEYQDLNYAQYVFVKMLCSNSHIMVIGDPDQSIYGFRGSDNIYFKRFEDDFPECEKIGLITNYRSTQTILDASFQMISKQSDDQERCQIQSHSGGIRKLVIRKAATETSEAIDIAKKIEQLVGGTSFLSMDSGQAGDRDTEYSFSDIAVLCRTSFQAKVIEKALQEQGIPCQSADRRAVFDTGPVQILLIFLQMILKKQRSISMDDLDTAVLTDQAGPNGAVLLENCYKACSQAENSRDIIDCVIKVLCEDKELAPLFEDPGMLNMLETIALKYPDLSQFLEMTALNQDIDSIGFDVEKVSLMTIHAAKGLEFPVVFVCGCEQGLLPYAKDGSNVDNLQEERRLFYVAMTRAKEILYLTYAQKRRIYGTIEKRQRSLFIDDIERALTQLESKPFQGVNVKKEKQLELF